jgi:hypothetical protein
MGKEETSLAPSFDIQVASPKRSISTHFIIYYAREKDNGFSKTT